MDSVTQFALGACVGVAVLGRKIGPRRAALTGGVLGTLPDLDVFLAAEDPIDSFIQHRGWSHSLFVHAALTPVFGEIVRLWRGLRAQRLAAYLAVFLCLTTHALLDAMTIYGTRLFWPLSTDPVGVGSIFIIDPLYTLPLLFALVWAACVGSMTPRLGKVLKVCLILSTAYLGWTAIAQKWVTDQASTLLAASQTTPDQMIAIPTPFNSLVWRVIGIDGDRYFNLYMPVFGGTDAAMLYSYDRKLKLIACSDKKDRIAKVMKFSKGYFSMIVLDNKVLAADLRMGLTPNYAFRFVVGRLEQGKLVPTPTQRLDGRGNPGEDLDWLLATLRGEKAIRIAEAHAHMPLPRYASINGNTAQTGQC